MADTGRDRASGRPLGAAGRQVAQQGQQVVHPVAAAGQIAGSVFPMGKPGGEGRVSPVAVGKGQAQQRSQRGVDGQPEILLRMDVGAAPADRPDPAAAAGCPPHERAGFCPGG